jgi:hypothetical protein
MFKLLAQRPVALRSLFITGVVTPDLNQVNYVGMGGCGLVFKGKYKGKHVALKVLYRGPHFNVSKSALLYVLLALTCPNHVGFVSRSFSLAITLSPIYTSTSGDI